MKMLKLYDLQRFGEEEAAPIAEVTEAAAPEQPAETPAQAPAGLPQSLLDALSERYQVEAGDMAGLEQAIRAQLEQPDVEEAPEDAEDSAETLDEGAQRIYDAWMEQAGETKQVYPEFDLRQEMASPRFAHLLRSGVDIRTAYEVLHKDEIIPAAMQYAARTVEQKLASALRASGSRPSENGMAGRSAAMVSSDVAHLSRSDYHEICKRVARGERVSFG